jgi:hypothetical protein
LTSPGNGGGVAFRTGPPAARGGGGGPPPRLELAADIKSSSDSDCVLFAASPNRLDTGGDTRGGPRRVGGAATVPGGGAVGARGVGGGGGWVDAIASGETPADSAEEAAGSAGELTDSAAAWEAGGAGGGACDIGGGTHAGPDPRGRRRRGLDRVQRGHRRRGHRRLRGLRRLVAAGVFGCQRRGLLRLFLLDLLGAAARVLERLLDLVATLELVRVQRHGVAQLLEWLTERLVQRDLVLDVGGHLPEIPDDLSQPGREVRELLRADEDQHEQEDDGDLAHPEVEHGTNLTPQTRNKQREQREIPMRLTRTRRRPRTGSPVMGDRSGRRRFPGRAGPA